MIADDLPLLRLNSFIERDDLTIRIGNVLKQSQGVILKGCQGVGKSTIAKKFGHTKRLNESIVRFFDSDSLDKLKEKYREMAEELEIVFDLNTNMSHIISSVYNFIKENIKDDIYFIFDNLIDKKHIDLFLVNLPSQMLRLLKTKANKGKYPQQKKVVM